ncbi:MAG: PIG-L deacetylase family protein [Pseudomonadota bacterium]
MIGLPLGTDKDQALNVLCLGAHCDDIEIGCGGTLLTLLRERPNTRVYWQVFTSTPERKEEAKAGAEAFAGAATELQIDIGEFRDGYLPYEGSAVKESIEKTKLAFSPDIIFTHYRHDLHQDHRTVSELTWNTFRNHLILEYEIPKWDGDLGSPNVFVEIDKAVAKEKVAKLQAVYNSQQSKNWFTDDLFHSLMRLRGMEGNSSSTLAEAFYARKVNLVLSG